MGEGASEVGSVAYSESRSEVLKMVAISATFGVLGAGWVWTGGPESGRGSGPLVMVVMVLSLVFGVVALVVFVPRLLSNRVLLVLDDEGFDDQASLMHAGRVRWVDVTELKLTRISGNDNIAIKVGDADQLHLARSGVGRLVARSNRRWADVWIPGSTLPVPARQVLDEMRARWMRSTAGSSPDQAGGH